MLSLAQCVTELLASPPAGSQIRAACTLPWTQAPDVGFPATLPTWLTTMLHVQGIERLAVFQAQALQHWQQGQHVCVAVPTGGGRGLTRLLALYQTLTTSQQGHALLVFPQKDREQAQLARITTWNAHLPPAQRLTAAIYDGDTPPTQRRGIRQSAPRLLLTTPEMLHAGMLAYHTGWRSFWQGLRAVVLADVHTCSGALGSHLTHLMQRLQRIARHYGAQPQFLLTSDPLARLQKVAQILIGHPCTLVSGEPFTHYQQSRILLEAQGNPAQVVDDLVARLQAADPTPHLVPPPATATASPQPTFSALAALRAAHDVRSVIFRGLPPSLGLLHACSAFLSSTQAYSLVILLLQGNTALERYVLRYPAVFEGFWVHDPGIFPNHPLIAQRHQACATAELAAPEAAPAVRPPTPDSPATPSPHRGVQLRVYERPFVVHSGPQEQFLTTVTPAYAFRHCFEGAIYTHHGQQFHVERLTAERRRILVRLAHVSYQTRGLVHTTVTEPQVEAAVTGNAFHLATGALTYTETMPAYERLEARTGSRLSMHTLATHHRQIRTQGVWLTLQAGTADEAITPAAVHTLVHATLASLPLFAPEEARDLRGSVQTDASGSRGIKAVFVDPQRGGNGTSALLYRTYERIFRAALQILLNCDCAQTCSRCVAIQPGCDTCIHQAPLGRQAGIALLQRMLGEVVPTLDQVALSSTPGAFSSRSTDHPSPRHLYLSLTTQRSADDVGGWQHKHLLGLGVAVTYDTSDRQYRVYTAETATELLTSLASADLVIGFTLRDFDYQVLQPYGATPLANLPTLAVLDEVQQILGFRLSLSHLVQETLGIERPDESLQTLAWFRQGDRERIAAHCRRDIDLLRALIQHGASTGSIAYHDVTGTPQALAVQWQEIRS